MKKIYSTIFAGLALCLGSCNMSLTPEGVILDSEALETVNDYENFTLGLYAASRGITSGDYVVLSDIQLDDFHAVIGNGNRRMEFYNGSFTPSTGEIASIYAGYYAFISQTNYLIQNGNEKLKESISKENKEKIQYCLATAHFFRAYCYSALADKYCGSYKNTADLDKEGTGLSLQLEYRPTSDNKQYPGRSSMRQTYKQILDDIDTSLKSFESLEKLHLGTPLFLTAMAGYTISGETVKALKARVLLNMGRDSEAFEIAKTFIEEGYYHLTERNNFKNLWTQDKGSEILWTVAADYTYHGSATGAAFASNITNSDYVPTGDCILLFDENDIRWAAWFEETKVTNSGGSASTYRFMKYPGNSELYAETAGSNFVNKGKPFRTSELYLIAAEASYNMNDEASANYYLGLLKSNRINRYRPETLAGNELITEIQNERHRELMGEGLRQADLKRWNIGFTRGEVWEGTSNVIVSNYHDLHYEAGDHRLVWPIPQHEMDANPQLNGQQNPGY